MSALPTRLVLLGHPVSHSLSPRFQDAALRAAGIPLHYEAVDVPPAELVRLLRELRAQGAAGNVTIPHKQAVAAACDRLTPLAARVGAVNCFWVEGGTLVGDNTDVGGFDFAVHRLLGAMPRDATIALLGAGGAAAAVLAAIERWHGCHVVLYNRTGDRAERMAQRFAPLVRVAESADEAVRDASLVVNATSVGLHDDQLPVAITALQRQAAVLDLVYRAGETAFVRAARDTGHRAADGLAMLMEQGALAFERWFHVAPDRAAMWRAVEPIG